MDKDAERRLVAGLKNQQEGAYEALLDVYGDRLFRFSLLLIQDEKEAEDILQEALVRVVRSIRGFREESSLYTWLCSIIRNLVQDVRRKKGQAASEELREAASNEQDVEEEVLRKIRREALRAELKELSPPYREVLVLFYYEGFSIRETAQLLSEKESTIRSRLTRARTQLRDRLAERREIKDERIR
ncbi:MAG: RNA polymerase sigma factor [Peptostreptococcaceae bacterium]|nr:RNA polymerase sigma factor [Peptostreptococcaceae bacterium]